MQSLLVHLCVLVSLNGHLCVQVLLHTQAKKQIEYNLFVIYFANWLLINALCVFGSSVEFSSDILCVWQSKVHCFEEPAVLCDLLAQL